MMIYYVEDEANIRELTLYALRQAGHDAAGFENAREFFAACEVELPALALLDIMLPETSGLDILQQLRENPKTAHLPVMMLTAKGTEYDKVTGLDAGADDYLAKPFGMMELVSRVNALLRRANAPTGSEPAEHINCGPVQINFESHLVLIDDQPLSLTLKEFDLLALLCSQPGRVFTREQLMQRVWGTDFLGETRTIDVHVQKLRQKLGQHSEAAGKMIQTVRGVGYSIKEP